MLKCARRALFSGNQVISHELLQWLQCAGWPKVLANSHSCDSLLHCTVAWAMMSSDRQFEQSGVDRDDARGLATRAGLPGSWLWLNGLRSDHVCFMSRPPVNQITHPAQG